MGLKRMVQTWPGVVAWALREVRQRDTTHRASEGAAKMASQAQNQSGHRMEPWKRPQRSEVSKSGGGGRGVQANGNKWQKVINVRSAHLMSVSWSGPEG